MKKLLITSTDLMMIQFLVPHVRYLSENGFLVEIACSDVGGRMEEVRAAVAGFAQAVHVVRLKRSPFSGENLRGYRDMKQLLAENHYDIIWTNEPVMGVVTRLAARHARKNGTKVLYMCHGFHFYKGAPVQNWLVYYPVERIMSRFTDVIVTINREDEARAKTWLPEGSVLRIDGIGVDFSRYEHMTSREEKRRELGIGDGDVLVVSVGELQKRKNHEMILRAIARLKDPNVKYYICGRGELQEELQKLARDLGMENQFVLLGYRRDVPQIMNAADIYAHPSLREGLGLASLEAMAAGLPLVTSNVQGIPDYVENGVTGFLCDPMDVESYACHLKLLVGDANLRREIGQTNLQRVKKYAIDQIQPKVKSIIGM